MTATTDSTKTIKIRIKISSDSAITTPDAVIAAAPPESVSPRFIAAAASVVIAIVVVGGGWAWHRSKATPSEAISQSSPAPSASTANPLIPEAMVTTSTSTSSMETTPAPLPELKSHQPVPSSRPAATPAALPVATPNSVEDHERNRVVRAFLTANMRGHAPGESLSETVPVSDVTKKFYFYTQVADVDAATLTHRWIYRGSTIASIPFKPPRGKEWRASSSKKIPNHMTGEWRVVLVNERGTELASASFTYGNGDSH